MFGGTVATVLECIGEDRLLLDVPGHDPVIASRSDVLPIAERVERFSTALESIPTAVWKVVAERAEVLRELLSFEKVTGPRLRDAARRLDLSTRQVNRLLRKFETTQATTALLPEPFGCKPQAFKLGAEKEEVIAKLLEDFYLQKERPRVADLHAKVAKEFRRRGWSAPCFETVQRRVELLDPKARDRARLGGKQARLLHSPVPGHVNVQAPLERVEIDHTLMNVIVRSDDLTSDFRARPTITIAVDVYTRCVLGFHIGFEPPSALAVALCLAHSAFPKDPKAAYGVDIHWPMHGLMKSIVVDNGKDFRSEAFRRGCMQYGILLGYRPVGSPHYGGVIERLIGTFMRRTEVLPGTTKANVVEKGEYDAVGKATMTLSQLRKWMAAQVAAYHASDHRMLRQPPASMWVQPDPVPLPDARTFLLDFLPGGIRTLSRTGVDMHCLQYWSEDFREHSTRKPRVRVTYDPRDISVVYVRLPDGKVTTARATRRDVPMISLAEWEMRRAHERAIAADPTYVQARDEADDIAEAIVVEAMATKKLRRRQETQAAGDPLRAEPNTAPPVTRAIAPTEQPHLSDPVSALLGGLRLIETPYFEVLDND
jgi:putative transposase